MKPLAIIPARSGSKGLKDKNIKLLLGKPVLSYTILAAIESKLFDEVHVSTDSEEYAKIAEEAGAKVPFLRSLETSTDQASSGEVIIEVLSRYKEQEKSYKEFALLQPTSPLRTANDIIGAYDLFCTKKASYVVSICESEYFPELINELKEDSGMGNFRFDNKIRRQDNPTYYRINGAIYFAKVEPFLKEKNFYGKYSFGYIMDRLHSVDIDSEEDFFLAEYILKKDEARVEG